MVGPKTSRPSFCGMASKYDQIGDPEGESRAILGKIIEVPLPRLVEWI